MDDNKEKKTGGQQPQSKRELYRKRFAERYPDDNFDDEETRYGRIMADAEERDRYEESDRKMKDLLTKHPAYGGMIMDAINGEDLITSLVSRFGKDTLLAALEDPEKAHELSKAIDKYNEQKDADERYAKESGDNFNKSVEEFTAFCDRNNLDDDKGKAVFGKCIDWAKNGMNGIFTADMFESALKSIDYDNDVQTAREEGEVQGRNANIEARLAKKAQADGGKTPPAFGGGTGMPERQPAKSGKVRNPLNGEMVEPDNNWRENGFKS